MNKTPGAVAWQQKYRSPLPERAGPGADQLSERELLSGVHGLAFSGDGKSLAVVLGGRSRMAIVEATSGRVIGYSGPESAEELQSYEVGRLGSAGFLLTPLPCGFVHRIRMADGDRLVLHDIESVAAPPDVGWDGRAFFAGENVCELIDSRTWSQSWLVPIQDW